MVQTEMLIINFFTDNLYLVQCRSQVYSEMSFDRCIHLCSTQSFKDADCFCYSRKFPLAAPWLLPVPAARGYHCSDLCPHKS